MNALTQRPEYRESKIRMLQEREFSQVTRSRMSEAKVVRAVRDYTLYQLARMVGEL